MPVSPEELKDALRQIARHDPDFFDALLDARFLRNPFPPERAGAWLTADASAVISPQCHLERCAPTAQITIGARSFINSYAWLRAWGDGIRIGADCTLHQYSMVQGGVMMGDGVRIGAHTLFIATEHLFARRDLPIHRQGTVQRGITLGSDIYIGSHVTVLDGVTVGDGAVIAAGAVVTRDVPAGVVAGGVPARVLKER